MIAISIRDLGRYFGAPVIIDGGSQPGEAWRSLLRIAGIEPRVTHNDDDPLTQRAITVPGHVLRGISVDIEQGSVTCLTGPSGCGKSVFLKILARVIAPTSGHVEIYGEIARLLSSGDNIDARMTAHENIQSSPHYRAVPAEVAERFQTEVIEFAELQGFEHVPLRTYSTGMLMRLNVALTLCSAAPIILMDDVFGVGVLVHAARHGNELQDRRRSTKGVRPGLADLAGDEHLTAVDLFNDHRHRRVFDEFVRRGEDVRAQLLGREPSGLDVVQQRN